MPDTDVRLKLKKSPRGYETCLGFGPKDDLLDKKLNDFLDVLETDWKGKDGFNLDAMSFEEKSEKTLQIAELTEVYIEKIKVSLYAQAGTLKQVKFGPAALAQQLRRE